MSENEEAKQRKEQEGKEQPSHPHPDPGLEELTQEILALRQELT